MREDWLTLSQEGRTTPPSRFDASYKAPSARALSRAADEATLVYGQLACSTAPVTLPLMDYAANFRDLDLITGRQREPRRRRSSAGGRSEWSLTAFNIMRRNLPVLAQGPFTLRAAGPNSSHGIGIAASAARTRARFDDFTRLDPATFDWVNYGGKSPFLMPATSAKFRASKAFTQVWTADPGLQFVGKSWYDQASSAKRGSFAPVDARMDRRAGDGATLSYRVTNFLDKSYAACI